MGVLRDFYIAEIREQHLGQKNRAVGLLERFKERDKESGESCAGPVDGMAEIIFAVFGFKPQVHSAGLKVAEVRAAGDFEISILAWSPDFDVIGFGGAESEVAGAEFDDAVVQPEQLQNFLRICGEAFEFLKRVVRSDNFD